MEEILSSHVIEKRAGKLQGIIEDNITSNFCFCKFMHANEKLDPRATFHNLGVISPIGV